MTRRLELPVLWTGTLGSASNKYEHKIAHVANPLQQSFAGADVTRLAAPRQYLTLLKKS